MSRPRLLVGVGVVCLLLGLAGCSAAGSLTMEPVDDAELAERASAALPTNDGPGVDRSVARRAVENGTATTVADRVPVETTGVYRHEGTFYRLSQSVVGTEPGRVVGYRVNASLTPAKATEEDLAVVDFEDLPSVDRSTLGPLVTTDRPDSADRRREPAAFRVTYREAEFAASKLAAGEVDAVRYDGRLYRVTVVERDAERLQVYRYEATTVAESPAAYARHLREEYAFELSASELSEDERSILTEATGGSYYAETTDDDAFAALVDRFRSRPAVTDRTDGGEYIVRYEGQLYWVEMRYGRFVD